MNDQEREGPRRAWRTEAEWNRLARRIDETAARRPRSRWPLRAGGIAAAAVLIVSVALTWRSNPFATNRPSTEQQLATTAAGERQTIHLPDSTTVELAPSSTLRYRISSTAREIELDGMARFVVTHDAQRPFTVKAGRARAEDLGTTFTVRAYQTDSLVVLAVTEGVVALSGDSTRTALRVEAGAVATVGHSGRAIADDSRDATLETAWASGSLIFRDATIGDVARELSRWFDVDVRVADDMIVKRKITASYASPTLDGVLDAVSLSAHVRVVRSGRAITLSAAHP